MKDNVKNLFQKEVENFVIRYQKPTIVDKYLRKSIFIRFEDTLCECRKYGYKTVLDVGCGAGIQALMLANEGMDVLGVDISKNMINRAKAISSTIFLNKQAGSLDFKVANFLEYEPDRKFDLVMALGVFDYTKHPFGYLDKMKKLAKKEIIASFPVAGDILFLQRHLRYKFFKHCDIYSYSEKDIKELAFKCSITDYRITKIGRDYLFCGYLK